MIAAYGAAIEWPHVVVGGLVVLTALALTILIIWRRFMRREAALHISLWEEAGRLHRVENQAGFIYLSELRKRTGNYGFTSEQIEALQVAFDPWRWGERDSLLDEWGIARETVARLVDDSQAD